MEVERVRVGKVPFDVLSLPDAVERILNSISPGSGVSVRLSNAYVVAMAASDEGYAALLNGPGVNFADGAPVAYLVNRWSRRRGSVGRVRGPSLFVECLGAGIDRGVRHFFLGASEETLRRMIRRAENEIPGIVISGSFSPPFGPLDSDFYLDACRRIEEANAQVVWVGLGSPKQDYATKELAALLDTPCIGVGAAFDFYAGTVAEAPRWVQRLGFEWAYRFLSEPRRLWRRYTIGNCQFLATVLTERVRGGLQ